MQDTATASSAGAEAIAAERQRQIDQEGYTVEHDLHHSAEQLALSAISYALPEVLRYGTLTVGYHDDVEPRPLFWQWPLGSFKDSPDDRRRELVKAGALIAAAIDRLGAAS